jgi:hypothetical protein
MSNLSAFVDVKIFTGLFISAVENTLGKKTSDAERRYLIHYINTNITMSKFTSIKLLVTHHVKIICDLIKKASKTNDLADNSRITNIRNTDRDIDDFDLHEYQTNAIGVADEDGQLNTGTGSLLSTGLVSNSSSVLTSSFITTPSVSSAIELEVDFLLKSTTDVYDFSKELVPKSKMRYNYITLDTFNCYEINDLRNTFTWLINDGSPVYQSGYINLHSKLRNIKMMRLGWASFSHVDLTTYTTLTTKRLGFSFNEFLSQALIMPSGIKFHFVQFMTSDPYNRVGSNITTSSFFENRGWFRFRERFMGLDKLTLSVYDLLAGSKVQLLDEFASFTGRQNINYSITYLPYSALPIRDPVEITSPLVPLAYNHNADSKVDYLAAINVLEPLAFSGFTTPDPVTDAALITAYNATHSLQKKGGGDIYGPPVSYVDLNASTIVDPYVDVTISLIYKPRLTVVLELISEDQDD